VREIVIWIQLSENIRVILGEYALALFFCSMVVCSISTVEHFGNSPRFGADREAVTSNSLC
jgi:hypothetical protein